MHYLKSYFVKMTFACLFMVFTMYAQKPQLTANDLAVNGESFFQMTQITEEFSKLARADGVLTGTQDFHEIAVSGKDIATIINQFKNCSPKPKYVLTDGGGIDLFQGSCQAGDKNCAKVQYCKTKLEEYIAEMKKAGVKAFVWTGYPEAPGNASLTTNQAIWTVVAKEVIAKTTEPKAIFVDLLPVFAGKYSQYFPSGDGLHPNPTGSAAAAKAFWDAMKADNYAFFNGTTSVSEQVVNNNRGHILSQVMINGNLSVSLSVDQPSDISLRLTTASGRSVFTAQQHAAVSGKQDVVFQTAGLARGVYCCEIRTGKHVSQSTLLIH